MSKEVCSQDTASVLSSRRWHRANSVANWPGTTSRTSVIFSSSALKAPFFWSGCFILWRRTLPRKRRLSKSTTFFKVSICSCLSCNYPANLLEFIKEHHCGGTECTVQQSVELVRLNAAWLGRDAKKFLFCLHPPHLYVDTWHWLDKTRVIWSGINICGLSWSQDPNQPENRVA